MFTTDKNASVRQSPGFFESHQMLLVQRSNSNSLEQLDAGEISFKCVLWNGVWTLQISLTVTCYAALICESVFSYLTFCKLSIWSFSAA